MSRIILILLLLSVFISSGCNNQHSIAHTGDSQSEASQEGPVNQLDPDSIIPVPLSISPYEIEEFINSQTGDEDRFIDFKPLWNRLQIPGVQDEAFDGFTPSSTGWRAEIINLPSSSTESNQVILKIELYGGAFRRYLIFTSNEEWRCSGHVDVIDCYFGPENSERIVSDKKHVFLVLGAHPRIGTGVSTIYEAWYRIDDGTAQEVLWYPVEGGRSMNEISDLKYKSKIYEPEIINDLLTQEIKYSVSFGSASDSPSRWLFSRKGRAYFVWDEASSRFIIDSSRSDFSEEEIETVFGSEDENVFIRANFERLVKLAKVAHAEEQEWFNFVVSKLPEGSEKTALQKALSQ